MGKNEIKELFQKVTIVSNGYEKKLDPSISNRTIFISKDRVYAGVNWSIKFNELKLDAANGRFDIWTEDGKRFKVEDRDVVKVDLFVEKLVSKYNSWKAKKSDDILPKSKKRARKAYGSKSSRRDYESTFDKFDEIVSSDEEQEFDDKYDNDIESVNRKSVCLNEDDTQTSVAVTDEEEIHEELPHTDPAPLITPQKPKCITSYFPSAKSIHKTNDADLVQDNPAAPVVPPKTPHKASTFFKPAIGLNNLKSNEPRLGLNNMGNSCYLNASLQMLFSLPSMFPSLHTLRNKSSPKLLNSVLEVSLGNTRDASAVKQVMDKITDKYHGFEQRDAHEFISDVVDNLHEEIKAIPDTISPIDMYFRMDLRVSLTCDSCQYRRSRDEVYRHLSLDIENASNITDALNNFFKQDTVHLSCENCTSGKTATRTMQIIRLPRALLLHLKRFIVDPPNQFRKNKAPVEFSSALSLRQFSSQDVSLPSPSLPRLIQDADEKSNPLAYSLKSVVHHIGSNANCGHYITDACREDKAFIDHHSQWKRFDDSIVSNINWDDVVSFESQKNAYMLLYELNV